MSVGEIATLLSSVPHDQPNSPEQFVQTLVTRGALTNYQAECILAERIEHLVLGNYVILDKLGQGGMGLVLKARHRRMDRIVALKVLSPESLRTPTRVERFQREARAAAKLSHPNIVTAFDADEHHGTHFLVMEYVEGRDLSSLVKEHGPLTVATSLDCILQAAFGLEYAHRNGVVHRDIKPGNLMVCSSAFTRSDEGTPPEGGTTNVKILDMGLASIESAPGAAADHDLTSTGVVLGTIDYMAPEQALDTKQADARSDIYSLGCSLFYLLTGHTPYPGDTVMRRLLSHRESPIPDLSVLRPDVSAAFQDFFQKLVAKNPGQRFQSMTEVIAAITAVRIGYENTYGEAYFSRLLNGATSGISGKSTSANSALRVPSATAPATISLPETVLLNSASTTKATQVTDSHSSRSRLIGSAVAVLVLSGAAIWFAPKDTPKHGASNQPERGDVKSLESPSSELRKPEPPVVAPKGVAPLLAVAPFSVREAKAHQAAWAESLGTTVESTNSVGMKMVLIPPGEFRMGSTPAQVKDAIQRALETGKTWGYTAISEEEPQHRVKLTQPRFFGATEVTIGQFKKFVQHENYVTDGERFGGGNSVLPNEVDPAKKMLTWRSPGYEVQDDSAVSQVTWNDAVMFCNWLSTTEQLRPCYQPTAAGDWVLLIEPNGYRLPTEAEWEFACRAGTTTHYYFGDEPKLPAEFTTDIGRPVASARPNPFGLFDMSGSVEEWCSDWWTATYYRDSPPTDPTGPPIQFPIRGRVVRGGNWTDYPHMWRSAYRREVELLRRYDRIGFRVVCLAVTTNQTAQPLDHDRRVAEWVLRTHGAVHLDGSPQDYFAVADLPQKNFKTTFVSFMDANSKLNDASLTNLLGLDSLKRLTLYDNHRVTDAGIAQLTGLPSLEHLDLRDTRMTNDGLKHLAKLNRLEFLVLMGGEITDEGIGYLEGCKQLRTLQLRLPQMTDKALANIPGLLTRLVGVEIGGSQVTDAGLAHLAGLQHLESLGLISLAISDDGLKQLQGLKKLGVLNLSRTPITDIGLFHLRGLTNLAELSLQESNVTAAGVAELQTALPKCVIHFP